MGHKTLVDITKLAVKRATEKNNFQGSAKRGHWAVDFFGEHENGEVYEYYHWDTLVLTITNGQMTYVYGESKSDADGLNAMCSYHYISARFTFRPVNGGFMQIA